MKGGWSGSESESGNENAMSCSHEMVVRRMEKNTILREENSATSLVSMKPRLCAK